MSFLEKMFSFPGRTDPYHVGQDDVRMIHYAFKGVPERTEVWFFMETRFLQGVFTGILLFYLMLYFTRRYKNKVS
ncbi:hypothetical protein C922_03038 [Plasmodium inui San Antonio 1]|uniref:Uncharacterized protein n=1 Tax=Plasmodium inui San Antonio 1 TaxID=1237626 RepID=W7AN27_9APIC|nr:hypothetical protein C922_03038 [Plasmodium inui San Antonio 1]EUD66711.1 hypothetical protein C922_03038 [Plasmodium inui San Antonio 1]